MWTHNASGSCLVRVWHEELHKRRPPVVLLLQPRRVPRLAAVEVRLELDEGLDNVGVEEVGEGGLPQLRLALPLKTKIPIRKSVFCDTKVSLYLLL